MKRSILSLVIICSSILLQAQGQQTKPISWPVELMNSYERYKYTPVAKRRIKHKDVQQCIESLGLRLKTRKVGTSVEGKSINMYSFGEGPISVLLWSQMHGNEPTATMALTDIFKFLNTSGDQFDAFREELSSSLTIHFIPMLNPDGAQRFERRNTQGIDVNRDALRLQTPEGQTLKRVRDSLDADWGFNLHDQGRTTSVGMKPATISVLAPAYNYDREVNEKRADAMQLIAHFNQILQAHIPGQVGRYWDDFEPRAFGDNIQKWGTRTILIESGGQYLDREKQEIRKLNYVILLGSLYSIATASYESYTTEDYFAIPNNERGLRDAIIRNVQLPESMGNYLTDLAYNFSEVENDLVTSYHLSASIVDIGDLSTSGAYLVHDMDGLRVEPGKRYEADLFTYENFKELDLTALLREGYTDYYIRRINERDRAKWLPVSIRTGQTVSQQVKLGGNPSLLFYDGDSLKYVLVNGYLFDPNSEWKKILMGMKDL
jgi:hypothetical protein